MERANETRIGLAELAEEDLAKVSGGKSIDEQKAEANAKYDRAMSAATAELRHCSGRNHRDGRGGNQPRVHHR